VTGLLAARKDQVDRTLIRAPLRGTVKNVRVNTIGGVIQPGQDIMEIAPREVAFLRPGLPAKVKLTAYHYTVYGALDGVVELISPDMLRDDRKSEEASYYRVLVRTTKSALSVGGRDLPIIPCLTSTICASGDAKVRIGEFRGRSGLDLDDPLRDDGTNPGAGQENDTAIQLWLCDRLHAGRACPRLRIECGPGMQAGRYAITCIYMQILIYHLP